LDEYRVTLEGQQPRAAKRLRIALCHLESLVGLPALNVLFAELGDDIDLVILSNRFRGEHGGTFQQLIKGVRRSGLRITLWLGFDIVAAQMVWRAAQAVKWLTGQASTLQTIRDLAARHRAIILETGDVNSVEIIGAVRRLGIDVVVVMNFDQILKHSFIEAAGAVVNVHPSLLPLFRGPCPVFWAMATDKSRKLGVSIHFIDDEQIDAGPVLAQEEMPCDMSVSVAEATSALFLRGARLLATLIRQGVISKRNVGGDQAARYWTFPTRKQIAHARAQGVRLVAWPYLARVVSSALRSGATGRLDHHSSC
jgi:folate-dependent phosphoribosylglycinamide formyltransferase PurN